MEDGAKEDVYMGAKKQKYERFDVTEVNVDQVMSFKYTSQGHLPLKNINLRVKKQIMSGNKSNMTSPCYKIKSKLSQI